jgi:hypothetical protein
LSPARSEESKSSDSTSFSSNSAFSTFSSPEKENDPEALFKADFLEEEADDWVSFEIQKRLGEF